MAKLTFNKEPYFDDFDRDKNFYKVLFRPSRSLQTRELNQLQSILGDQLETFANHIFKFGSMVKSGSIRYLNYTPYVRLKDLTPTSQAIDVSYFSGRRVQGVTSGLLAQVILTAGKDDFDPATIFVEYLNTAIDGETSAFVNGETIQVLDDQGYVIYEAVVRCPDCATNADPDTTDPTGFGSIFSVEPTVFYIHGHMVPSQYQVIYLDKYDVNPSYKIGFDIVQSIVSADDDISLLDNSLGSPNFAAPGADRYKIQLVLTKKPLADDDDENFVLLAKTDYGTLQEIRDKPQYAEIMEMIARRTYDESGDYTVRPFRINFREHLKLTGNDGWKEEADGGDETKFITTVSPGKAYVRGYELENIAEKIVEVDKARDTEYKRSSVIRTYMGNYITVTLDPVGSILPITDVTASNDYATDFGKVNLYDDFSSGGNYAGNQIGTARIKNIELQEGDADDPAAVWRLYVFEMVLQTGKTIQDVKGLHRTGGGDQTFSANIEPDPSDGVTNKVYDPNNNKLLWPISFSFCKSIRDADNPLVSNTAVTVVKKLVGAVNSLNKVVFSAEGDETYLDFDATKWVGGLQEGGPGANFLPYDLTTTDTVVGTPSQITIQNIPPAHVGKNFVLTCEVLKSNAKEKTKVLNTKFLNDIAGDASVISLQVPDAFRLVSVTDVTDADPLNHFDVTSNYKLVPNMKDNYYDISELHLRSGVTVPDPGTLLDIEIEYFQHSGTGYYFSVDSYTSIINDSSIDFDYEDIPTFTAKDGTVFRLSDTLDFRPSVGTDGTFSHATASLTNVPIDNSNVIFDVEYYLPRVDLLCLRDNGNFVAVKGTPHLEPDVPKAADNSMAIYQIYIDAYTFDIQKNIRMVYLDNKRYTMRDIGKLEKRIANLEYYVTFNLLEKATADQEILDADGNNRFKNGFLVDNFKDFIASDTASSEYTASLDTTKGELRPSFASRSVALELNDGNSTHYAVHSQVVTLPYTEEVWMEQPFASKTISVNPYFIFNQEGIITLVPDNDFWKDTITEPAIINSLDTGFEAISEIANAAGVLGTTWGNWITTSSTRTSNIITSEQTRTGVNTTIEEEITELDLGTFVTEVNIIPYIRSREVQFVATDLRPNTRVYAFFDDVKVSEDCRPLDGSNGQAMVSDANGSLVGVFTIPNREDKRFFTGDRVFRLTNHEENSLDPDELTTSAQSVYHSGGLQETTQNSVLSVTTPALIETEVNQTRTTITAIRRSGDDPLAQSFSITDTDNGVFLTGCDIFFSAKDDKVPVWFQIRNMVNGYPGPVIVPFSECSLKPDKVKISEDASVATRFQFRAPVYLQADTDYCFVVGSDIETYRIYVSKLGGTTISNPQDLTISTQPHLGSLFKSQNDKTWTAEQFEDIMFTLYRADFDTSADMGLSFTNKEFGLKTPLEVNPFETETGSRDVRVYMKNHGLNANDKVKLELLQDTGYQIDLVAGNLVVGQEITGGTNGGTAIILKKEDLGGDSYRVNLANLKGFFADGEQVTGPIFYETFNNQDVLNALDVEPIRLVHNVAVGSFPTGVDNLFNGIPLTDLSTPEHLIQHVDSMDSFIIQVDTQATGNGRVGGDGTYAVGNIQTDAFAFQLNYIDFRGDASWNVSGVGHAAVGSNVTDYSAVGPVSFVPNETKNLVTPMKIASIINEDMNMASNPSIDLTCSLGSDDSFVSPVINLDGMSFTAITNRVEWNDCDNYSVSPQASTDGNPVICDEDDIAYTANHRWKVETDYDGGSEGAKYIMKPVNLDNPATNIKVYMDLLTFLDTEVQFFYRTLPAESDDEIKNQEWVQAWLDQEVISETDTEFREAEISIPPDIIDVLPEFKAFQVKLVLRSQNTARPPKVKNFRAIAVL